MKRSVITLCAAVAVSLAISSVANAAILTADFTSIVDGAFSYDYTGANVVKSGNAFYDTVEVKDYLGQGESQNLSGNFAFYAVCNYTDNGALAYAKANPSAPLSLEVRINGFTFSKVGGGTYTDNFTLDLVHGVGIPVTFAELATPGYADLTTYFTNYLGAKKLPDGFAVYVDLALGAASGVPDGQVALSIIMKNYLYTGGSFVGTTTDIEATYATSGASALQSTSGAKVVTPEPCTILVWSLLGLAAAGFGAWRRRRA